MTAPQIRAIQLADEFRSSDGDDTPWLIVSTRIGAVLGGAPTEHEARHLVSEIGRVCWIVNQDNDAIQVHPS